MNELYWLSDIHADVFGRSLVGYYEQLRRKRPRSVLVTGDISNALRLEQDLCMLSTSFDCEIFFTLGNHDYYGSSFERVHELVRAICTSTYCGNWGGLRLLHSCELRRR